MKYVIDSILFLILVSLLMTVGLSCQPSQKIDHNVRNEFFLENELLSDIEKMMNSNGHEILILRIKETDCSQCIDLELNNIKRFPEKITKNILILAEFSNDRVLSILKRKYSISHPILKYDKALNSVVEAMGKPYYFVLGRDNMPKDLYISNLSDSLQFIQYLTLISADFN